VAWAYSVWKALASVWHSSYQKGISTWFKNFKYLPSLSQEGVPSHPFTFYIKHSFHENK